MNINGDYYGLYINVDHINEEFVRKRFQNLDNTLGIDWIGRDWATRDIYDWANQGEDRPLHKRLLGLKKYRDRYSYHINRLITGVMNPDTLFPRIDSIRASSVSGPENTEPCEGIRILVFESSSPDQVINEFMAGNILVKADEYGEFDDWVELYNRDVTPVWLGDKYLSDDLQDPARWKLPDQVLDPSEFILVWADGQNSQGPAHSSFRLNKSGEEIGIFESPERNSAVIDYLAYVVQQDDISYGRSTDGGNDWLAFGNSTPGYSNFATPLSEVRFREEPVRAFLNPVIQGIVYFSRITSVPLHDLSGRQLLAGKDTDRMYIGDLPAGVYILNFPAWNVQKIILSK